MNQRTQQAVMIKGAKYQPGYNNADKKRHNQKRKNKRRLRFLAVMLSLLTAGFLFLMNRDLDIRRLRADGCPESLAELAERNPETIRFVEDFSKYTGPAENIDLSAEVVKGVIPLFLQWDERWGYEKYGDDYLAVTGCGPTCISMVYCGLTGNTEMNPYEIAAKAQEEGFYVEGCGSSWNMMDIIPEELGIEVHSVVFDREHILQEIESGRPIICIMGPGDFTTSGHFIVLKGIDDNGDILVNDPNSLINSAKSWNLEQLMKQIRNLWSFSR